MGYTKHEAVIVTAAYIDKDHNVDAAFTAWRETLDDEIRQCVIGPFVSPVNQCMTWVFLPDGSKEWWSTSDAGDKAREEFKALFRWGYNDGSSPYEFAHVVYGGDYVRECKAELAEVHPPRSGEAYGVEA